jgi:hypothetical protein
MIDRIFRGDFRGETVSDLNVEQLVEAATQDDPSWRAVVGDVTSELCDASIASRTVSRAGRVRCWSLW